MTMYLHYSANGILRTLGCGLLFAASVWAQGAQPQLSVSRPSRHAVSPRLSELPDVAARAFEDHPPLPLPARRPGAIGPQAEGALQTSRGPLVRATTRNNFDGIGANGSAPPDTNIAVGPNHIVEVVNSRYQVFNKAGTSLLGPRSLGAIWTPLGGSCATENAGDPVVQYDRLADRWVITELGSLRSPYSECIAVSTTNDPTGAYNLYSYPYGTTLNDYPKVGVWPTATNSAYTVTYNLFASGRTFAGGRLCTYDRAAMIAGAASPAEVCFTISNDGGFLPVDLDGATPPVDGTPAYFLTWETSSSLRIYKLSPNFANTSASTITTMPDLAVAGFSQACGSCVPQAGTSQTLDTLSDRPMYRLAYRMFSGHASMVVNHTVTSGPGSTTGIRWYELRSPVPGNGNFSVYQQATFAPDATYRWMGSAAMDQAGNLAIGYSASSSAINPALRYTGRNAGDPLHTLQTETSILVGTGSQTTGLSRWGDYASLRIDPADDCTFWFSTEYEKTSGTFNWVTHMGSFQFTGCGASPQPDFSISASPSSLGVLKGNNGSSTINLTALNGFSGSVALSVSGCPPGATCSFTPPAVTPTGSSALNIATGTASAGSYSLTVTGTSGTLTHSTPVALTIQPPPDFSISASPTTISLAPAGSGGSTITLSPLNGYAKSVALSVTGCPQGATCSFAPGAVVPPGSSALSVSAGSAGTGSYNLTIQGADGTLSHTTAVTLSIQAAPDFTVGVNPASVSVRKGNAVSTVVTVTQTNGSSPVSLSVTGLPSGVTATFAPPSVVNGNATLTLDTRPNTTRGTYPLIVKGTSSAATRQVALSLTVQ